jgi:hypothetical protein
MEPNVQVALVGVMTTFITTLGVVTAAWINSLQSRAKAAEKVVETVVDDDLDEEDVMEKILLLIDENQEKTRLLSDARREINKLTQENRHLRAENTMLRLGGPPPDLGDQPDL